MNELHIEKGTTLSVGVRIVQSDGTVYQPQSGDTVRLTVKEDINQYTAELTLTGAYDDTEGYYIFGLEPDDTDELPAELPYTRYWYDVTLQTNEGDFYRVIPVSPFLLHPGAGQKEA